MERSIACNTMGRHIMVKINNVKRIGFIHSIYPNRAMEWICICQICKDALIRNDSSELLPMFEHITFGWKYHGQLRSIAYQPAKVFCDFSFSEDTFPSPCPCNMFARFNKFLDPLIVNNFFSNKEVPTKNIHVRTINVEIICNTELKK